MSDMTNYKSAFGMVCRIKNRHTFKSLPILNSAYFTECRFVIRHITQTDTETETEANFTHHIFGVRWAGVCVGMSICTHESSAHLCFANCATTLVLEI